ncbi:MAG: hypothetical protein AAF737_02255 [Pseudomonadota bacterium]
MVVRHTGTAIFTTLVAALCAATSMASAKPPTGRFLGCVTSAGILTPVVTRLTDQYQGIGGSYTYLHEGERVDGTLEHIGVEPGGVYSMIWSEEAGTGELRIQFTPDTNGFSGRWTSVGENAQYDEFGQFWSGNRSEAELESMACGAS